MSALRTAVLLFAAAVTCDRYIFSFGDSYSTVGFNVGLEKPSASNPIGNPAFPGITTSGGINHIGVFSTIRKGTLAYDFAASGAAINNTITQPSGTYLVPDFVTQRTYFEENLVPPPSYAPWTAENSIFTAFFGINDITQTQFQGTNPITSRNRKIFETYRAELDALYSLGARRFILLTVPPFNQAPVYNSGPNVLLGPVIARQIDKWNRQLNKMLNQFTTAHPDASMVLYHTDTIWSIVLANPTAYGAPNATCYNKDGTSCLFWDDLHPGQAIQKAWGVGLANLAGKLGFFT